ncbi:WD domain-containing protein, G-beta repeat-containing protein [Nonomuraea solani]|uniref:WD domain-containing protein, G-beta repeat-containing protein n=1 Tax=Nonomuraea solani TaxID=1144553 RepID=A0A1H5YDS0_9ACTN|nr:WD40 repeat domain-containing protein [Nonomuraea solani]SEG21875.1 WD domain-containing protein, G-beta repeat-containing protein [Nonomuraea solani]
MPALRPVLTSQVPSESAVLDFDLVVVAERPLVVCTHHVSRRVCTWDPTTDEWAEYQLDNPWLDEGNSDRVDYTDLTALGAAVVNGRIVVGGGGDHQGFAQWDLETGAVLDGAEPTSVSSARAVTLSGQTLFVLGFAAPGMEVQSPAKNDSLFWLTDELECEGSIAAGTLWGRSVIAANGVQGGITVWDFDEDEPIVELDVPDDIDDGFNHFALVTVQDQAFLVAAGERVLAVCDVSDADDPVWAEPITVPGGNVECLDAGVVDGRVVAATGGEDGTLCLWDIADRRLLAEPNTAHRREESDASSEVFAVRFTELNARPAVITAGRDHTVRLWDLPEIKSNESR